MSLGRHIDRAEITARIRELHEDGDEDEAAKLQDALDEVSWSDNPDFIRHDWFWGGYAEFLAEQFGSTRGWPYDCIDWEKATQELAMDHKVIVLEGDDYYVRA